MKNSYGSQLSAFSAKVKATRLARRMTQLELAAKADVDVQTIHRLETTEYNPTYALMLAVAEALGVELKTLL